MRSYVLGASAIALGVPLPLMAHSAEADDAARAILVNASRSGEPLATEDYPGSVSVLSSEDIELRQVR
ncbi:MAG TPA: hypothetical protein VK839_09285, partial [Erythrobacter sp.]|nr:hypothetical protein [Erythrobacter sp.]